MKHTVFFITKWSQKPSLKIFYAYAFFKLIHVLLKNQCSVKIFFIVLAPSA